MLQKASSTLSQSGVHVTRPSGSKSSANATSKLATMKAGLTGNSNC